jgi:hypothetical protein
MVDRVESLAKRTFLRGKNRGESNLKLLIRAPSAPGNPRTPALHQKWCDGNGVANRDSILTKYSPFLAILRLKYERCPPLLFPEPVHPSATPPRKTFSAAFGI